MAGPDLAVEDVIDALDSFYCHNVVVGLWADAAANRLEGMAIYLLSDEFPEVIETIGGRDAAVLMFSARVAQPGPGRDLVIAAARAAERQEARADLHRAALRSSCGCGASGCRPLPRPCAITP